jgi:DNA-binding response OmpR family regulator
MDGFSLGRIIKARKPAVPVIYLTAKSFTEDVLTGFEAGASDYIRKPFSIEELIARIHNQLRMRDGLRSVTSSNNPGIALGCFLFFPEKLELVNDSVTVKLSYRETQVLSLLAQNVNQATDRKALLLAVWGDDSCFNSRTLDVYVRKLRTYFEKDSSIEIITLKGKGYVFHISNQ